MTLGLFQIKKVTLLKVSDPYNSRKLKKRRYKKVILEESFFNRIPKF